MTKRILLIFFFYSLGTALTAGAQQYILEQGLEWENNAETEEALIFWLDRFIETVDPSLP